MTTAKGAQPDAGPLTTEQVLAEEAGAIHGEAAGQRVEAKIPPPVADGETKARHYQAFYRELNGLNSTALCLSGGGIRSAAFALGVIQALATHPRPSSDQHGHVDSEANSLLRKFHYLSTVSGGGYIGSWLSACISRAGFPEVWKVLVGRPEGPDVEHAKLAWLRTYSNYLTPKIGAMSADTWAAAAIVGRNLLLNWLVILPLLCGILLMLKFYAGAIDWLSWANPDVCVLSAWNPTLVNAAIGTTFLLIALSVRSYHVPTRGHSTLTQGTFLWFDLGMTMVGALFFVWALAAPCPHTFMAENEVRFFAWSLRATIWYGLAVGMALYLLSWYFGRPTYRRVADFRPALIAWIAAGAIFGTLMALGVSFAHVLWTMDVKDWGTNEIVLFIGAVPWVLMSQVIAEFVLVGLTSSLEGSDDDREWLGRVAGWMLVVAVGWFALMALVFLGSGWIKGLDLYPKLQAWLVPLGGISGVLTALLGKSNLTRSTGDKAKPPTRLQVGMDLVLTVSAIVFAVAVVILTSALIDQVLFGQSFIDVLKAHSKAETGFPPVSSEAYYVAAAFVLVAAVGWVASRYVNINRFSLHALYRNRLVRAFLGASVKDREKTRNPFTGFNEGDNLPMQDLWPARRAPGQGWRPFHVINMALNIVLSEKLAWQERKAEPFTVSPLHSGTACKSYRSSKEYGDEVRGISLGTAMAISGAAASPNMGYHSAPSITFLMALLNVRLGWWLGNPGKEGEKTFRRDGPGLAIRPLLSEMFGLTTDKNKYIYLSDGAHFENLGIYEMVRRRCRLIVVSDAGYDPKFEFDDLGNAVRKIFLDLGVRISFQGIENLATLLPGKNGSGLPYHAMGTIHYAEADGGGKDGLILYIKPAYHGNENIGIRSYVAANPDFPHQGSGDQFFSESQFESYRALGFEITDSVLKDVLRNNPPEQWAADGVAEALKQTPSADRAAKSAQPI